MKNVNDELEKRAWWDNARQDYVICVKDVKAMLGIGRYELSEEG